jgi:DNA segregation ATPase FtsK/SpoIIIE, S-DNA-T family
MKIKFTLQRPGGEATDLVAELDASATVGQLATHLALADPRRRPEAAESGYTLALVGAGGRLLGADEVVAESELCSGVTVSLAQASRYADDSVRAHQAAARVTVLAGPDRGREVLLPWGAAVVGRERGCEVRLTDPMVSRRHVRINVGELVEVVDLGSANGVQIGLAPTQRATLNPGDVVTVGDTQFAVARLEQTVRAEGAIEFVRPARVTPVYGERRLDAPEVPERKEAPRFPTVALVLPLILGAVMYATTHVLATILFVALSPLMLIGNAVEGHLINGRTFRKQVESFHEKLTALVDGVRADQADEVAARLAEHPAATDGAAAAERRGELLWSRRPDRPGFAELRLGLGTRPSRTTIELPTQAHTSTSYELVDELEAAVAGVAQVSGVPVTADLAAGAVGLAGPRTALLSCARAVVAQLASLHSPAELALACVLDSRTASDWDWLKWLPHTTTAHSPLPVRHLAATQADAVQLLAALENLIEERSDAPSDQVAGTALAVLVESGAPVEHSRLVDLAERGPAVGVYVVWLAADRAALPASCSTFLELSTSAIDGRVGYVIAGEEVTPVLPDALDAAAADRLAHALAPVNDAGARRRDDSDLPRSISQFATLQDTSLGSRPESVIERWQASSSILTGPLAPKTPAKKAGSLRAIIGMSASGLHALDLRTDGPHALVGGTTNSGKSELLQAWILSLATLHSPERVTFLLVDYKGGSAFADCVDLPHTIGLVTDLSPHMVRRALTSLSAELKYREELLHRYGAKDLIELEKHGVAGAPPSLVIVVDEFAALVQEVPEFVEGVVNVAQRGRSLGLHLILATQQPSGVIKGSLRANTNLRIALRVADETDSTDVLGAPDAAGFDPAVPGRAMSRSGPKRLVAFQTSYAGGWTSDEPEPPSLYVEELALDHPMVWEVADAAEAAPKDRQQTDIKRLVATIGRANEMAGLPVPRKAWLPVLPAAVDLSTVPAPRSDAELVFALGDDAERQRQPAVAFRPDREGNLAVYGTGGSGKSTLLRSLAIAAGFAQRGGPCHVYALDYGSRALQMLELLPHVGSVVPGSDTERVGRLITWLRQAVDERAVRYAAANAGTITDYRVRANRPDEPRILVLVDNVGGFRSANETTDRMRYVDLLTSIAAEGRPVGIHLVLAAAERTALTTALSSSVQRRLVMRMASEDDYSLLGVPTDVLDPSTPAGRALDAEQEIQVGILGTSGADAEQAAQLAALAAALRAAGVQDAPAIVSLPEEVPFAALTPTPQEVPLGIDSGSLAPIGVDAHGGFLLVGPPSSGRSTALTTLVCSTRASLPDAELHYIGNRRSTLAGQEGWASLSVSPEEAMTTAQELAKRVAELPDDAPRVVVVIEGAGDYVMSPAEQALQALVRACLAGDHWVVAEGEVSTMRSSTGFLGLVRGSRRGLALQPDQETGLGLFNTAFPRTRRADFPEGRGFLVGAGRAEVIQVALP